MSRGCLRRSAAAVGVTHYDVTVRRAAQDYYDCFLESDDARPAVHVNAKESRDVAMLICSFLAQLEFG